MIKNKGAQLFKVRLVCYSLCKMHIYKLHKQLPTHKQHKHKYKHKHKHKQLPTQPSRHDPAFPAIPILTQEQQSGELLATNCGNCTPRLKPAPFFRNTNLYNFRCTSTIVCNGSYQFIQQRSVSFEPQPWQDHVKITPPQCQPNRCFPAPTARRCLR